MADSTPPQPPPSSGNRPPPPKRKSSAADLNDKPQRPTKRRASKACQSCRTRKVRCNVVEHGPPCTNCRLDEIECVVTESKRKRRTYPKNDDQLQELSAAAHLQQARERITRGPLDGIANLQSLANDQDSRASNSSNSNEHIPHSLYRIINDRNAKVEGHTRPPMTATYSAPDVSQTGVSSGGTSTHFGLRRLSSPQKVPDYLKPVPTRMGADEVDYLQRKGALCVPDTWFRDELCLAYAEFVHPYMPSINIHEFFDIMQKGDGSVGKISLLLFQAIMFAGSAFVDSKSFKKAGFATRKDMRKVYFQRVRYLYDFDYDIDRFSQVQTLLLMTSWYETSDDKKDAWHWMGIAIATSYTIGLHRDPARSNMDPAQQRQWKRVWWACVIRDRLIALGARRPIRIKPEDCDVPMLTLADFEFGVLSEDNNSMSRDCKVVRDVQTQTALATMCIEKAKLCMCISEVLTSQYSIQKFSNGITGHDMRKAAILSPKPVDMDSGSIMICHQELESWANQLPEDLKPPDNSTPTDSVSRRDAPVVVQRALLHLIYYATLSALHRPQVLHNIPAQHKPQDDGISSLSRDNLRRAALETTKVAKMLLDLDLVQYLPTTGVSVMQPAIISHLLDIKSPDEDIRRTALSGFCQCIQVMEKLRDCYTAADHSIALVEAAVRRADIKIPVQAATPSDSSESSAEYGSERTAATTEDLLDAGRRESFIQPLDAPKLVTMTPPSETVHNTDVPKSAEPFPSTNDPFALPMEIDIARKLEVFLASTPLYEQPQTAPGVDYLTCMPVGHYPYEADFDAFVNFGGGDWDDPGQSMPGQPFVPDQGNTPGAFDQYAPQNQPLMFFNSPNAGAGANMNFAGLSDAASDSPAAAMSAEPASAATSPNMDPLRTSKGAGGGASMQSSPAMSVAVPG